MVKHNLLFAVPLRIHHEVINGISLFESSLQTLQTLPSGKIVKIGFLLDEGESERSCYVLSTEHPTRSDKTVSANCLKMKMWYYTTGSEKKKVFACVKVNLTQTDVPSAKNDMFYADSQYELDNMSEGSVKKQKRANQLVEEVTA